MENNNAPKFAEMRAKFESLMQQAPKQVGVIALGLFKESFTKQGQIMQGGNVKKWPSRGAAPKIRSGSSLLINRGALRRDLNMRTSARKVAITSNMPYSKIQNDGGTIPITSQMRKFFWAMYKESKDDFWKGMALTSKTQLTIKPRPFLYDTPELAQRLDKHFIPIIKQILSL